MPRVEPRPYRPGGLDRAKGGGGDQERHSDDRRCRHPATSPNPANAAVPSRARSRARRRCSSCWTTRRGARDLDGDLPGEVPGDQERQHPERQQPPRPSSPDRGRHGQDAVGWPAGPGADRRSAPDSAAAVGTDTLATATTAGRGRSRPGAGGIASSRRPATTATVQTTRFHGHDGGGGEERDGGDRPGQADGGPGRREPAGP